MFNKIKLFFKTAWLCGIVTKTLDGITATLNVLKYVRDQVEGSEVGDLVLETILDVEKFLESVQDSLVRVSSYVCSKPVVVTQANKSIEDSIADLRKITNDLNQ